MTIDLSKRDSKDAAIKISLKANSGYSATTSGRVSPKQWGAICAIMADQPTEAEKQRDELLAALELCRPHMYEHAGNTPDNAFDAMCQAIVNAKGQPC